MAQRYADDNAKATGSVFPLTDRKSDKQPEYSGLIEISRSMLKSMVEEAKAGHMPVKLRAAVWPHQTGQNPPHHPYRFVKLEVMYPKDDSDSEGSPAPEAKPEAKPEQDDLPW